MFTAMLSGSDLWIAGLVTGVSDIFDPCHEKIDPFKVKNIVIFWSLDFCKFGSICTFVVNLVSK